MDDMIQTSGGPRGFAGHRKKRPEFWGISAAEHEKRRHGRQQKDYHLRMSTKAVISDICFAI